jgi:glycerol-3-phosphate dehydrogenase
MHRALARLSDESFDLLIIGGGVTAASVARDAALRGLKVALVEKNDFANATSAHNSKLVHGGLRYLRNFELGLVRESLKERRILQRIAPHLVHPLPFLVPVYGGGMKERATLAAGLTLYDLLSFDKGWLDDPDQRLSNHRWLSKSDAIAREPMLDAQNFEGAFLYYDAQMYSPERLALEFLIDADAHGAALANYVEAERLLVRSARVEGCAVRDSLADERFEIRAKLTLVAAGPWADIFLAQALGKPATHKLMRSKGIHLLVPAMTKGDALTVATKHGHFFVLPWRGHTLLGTTDTAFKEVPDAVSVSERDIVDFLSFINAHLPQAKLKRNVVEYFYAGLRPLVDDGSGNTYGASRRSELIDHAKDDKIEGLLSAIGGKWTTSRELAEIITDAALEKLSLSGRPSTTATTPLPGARFSRFRDFLATQKQEHVLPTTEHLAHMYGARLPLLLKQMDNRPELAAPMGPNGDIAAGIVLAAREEMAVTLCDAVMRRTGIGQFGPPPRSVLDAASKVMALELGWNEDRRVREIDALLPWYETREAA